MLDKNCTSLRLPDVNFSFIFNGKEAGKEGQGTRIMGLCPPAPQGLDNVCPQSPTTEVSHVSCLTEDKATFYLKGSAIHICFKRGKRKLDEAQ